MINKTTISPSQSSHGGTLYYVYEIPKDEYHYKKIEKKAFSTDSGWDNPFRPDGDLSREADEIVNLIKGGKPITPTGEQLLVNGSHMNGSHEANGTTVVDSATKLEVSPLLNQSNGTKSPQKSAANGGPAKEQQPQVSNQTVPGPQSASCVVIDEKKKKGSKCCVIQ